jgi:hypothetical protein
MAARQGAEAVTEFQKILDHRGAVVGDPIGALAIGQSLRAIGRPDQGKDRLSGFPHPLERRRPRHSGAAASQGRVREAELRQQARLA